MTSSHYPHTLGPSPLELTLRGTLLGALITIVFTSSNVYLGLKVGLTFSSSIPAAVISMAILRFFPNVTILENNMVQTQASAAGTLSAVIFILPALLMIGHWQAFPFWQTMMICFAGGTLGVIFSIPLRRTMVVNSDLPYPEGVAAAEILHAGHDTNRKEGANGAKDILFGGLIASAVTFCTSGLHLFVDKTSLWLQGGKAIFQIPIGFSLALVSAGYLMGMAAGAAMFVGLLLAWGVFVPCFAAYLPESAFAGQSIAAVGTQIWVEKVRFIGAGTIAVAAVWTLIILLKPMVEGVRLSFRSIHGSSQGESVDRTYMDMSASMLLKLTATVLILLAATFYSFVADAPISPILAWGFVAFSVSMVFLIGFFIAAACGYMAGLVGSSNSPISGIGIVGLIVVSSLIAVIDAPFGMLAAPEGKRFCMALAIFVTAAVVSVAAIANDNLQDLKTGFLVGATPKNQQIALVIGCAVGAVIIAPILDILYQAYGFSGAPLPREGMNTADLLSAPQATLMSTITLGIFSGNLDWNTFILGGAVGVGIIGFNSLLKRISSSVQFAPLAVGLAIYLPPSITSAIIVGAVISMLVERRRKFRNGEYSDTSEHNKRGVLLAAGFIVGESLTGVVLAIVVLVGLATGYGDSPLAIDNALVSLFGTSFNSVRVALSALIFLAVCLIFYKKSSQGVSISPMNTTKNR